MCGFILRSLSIDVGTMIMNDFWEPILRYDPRILLESLRKTAGDFCWSSLLSDWIQTENIRTLNVSYTIALTHSVSMVTKLLRCGEGRAVA
jgi:hypothetical protein